MKDQLKIHKACIENIETRISIQKQIDEYKEIKDLIINDPLNQKVSFWTLSEVEDRINKENDLLHNFKMTYKDLVSVLKDFS